PLVVAATAWEVEEGAGSGAQRAKRSERGVANGKARHWRGANSSRRDEAPVCATPVNSIGMGQGVSVDDDRAGGVAMIAPGQRRGLSELCDIDLYRLLRPTVARTAHEK